MLPFNDITNLNLAFTKSFDEDLLVTGPHGQDSGLESGKLCLESLLWKNHRVQAPGSLVPSEIGFRYSKSKNRNNIN